jgi:hypothetical protein
LPLDANLPFANFWLKNAIGAHFGWMNGGHCKRNAFFALKMPADGRKEVLATNPTPDLSV